MRKRKTEPEGRMEPCLDERRTKSRCLAVPETKNPEEKTNFGGFCRNYGGKIINLEGGDNWTAVGSDGFGLIGTNKEKIKREDSLGNRDHLTDTINTQE